MRTLATAALLLCSLAAHAAGDESAARAADRWSGKDKQMHFAISAFAGVAAAQLAPHNEWAAFGVAMIPGIIKEIGDSQTQGNFFSVKDLAADALGAYVGVKFGHFLIRHNHVTYTREF